MARVQVLYWHDIPLQVRAGRRGNRGSVELDPRFQAAADQAAMAHPLCLKEIPPGGEPGVIALAGSVRTSWETSHGLAVLGDESDCAWVAVASDQGTDTRCLRFRGSDYRARVWTTTLTLEFLRRLLLGLAAGWAE